MAPAAGGGGRCGAGGAAAASCRWSTHRPLQGRRPLPPLHLGGHRRGSGRSR